MTNKETEQKIRQAFSNAVPDIRDSVLSDCRTTKGATIIMTNTNKKHSWGRRLAGLAAAFVLLIGGMAGFQVYQANYTIASTVSLDVNPSLEIQINQKEQVLAVNARNEDAKIVIGDMDFKGSSLDVTINALIGSMLRNGYLNEIANSILISVDNEDFAKGAELQERLAEEINAALQTGTFSGAVLSQTISADPNLRSLADTYGITLGKAQLIQQIISQNALYSFADLVPLSINELNLLSESGNLNLENINSSGTASDKAYIGKEKALETALSHAGIASDAVNYSKVELDYENGAMVYEVEFTSDGYEYDYDIDAVSGSVLINKKEPDDDYIPPQISGTPDPVPSDPGQPESVQPPASNDVNSGYTGTHHPDTHHDEPRHSRQSDSCIGDARAMEIAFSHAGVPAGNVLNCKCELDTEDGITVYEIEFDCGGYEYEYDIDAVSGSVLKYDKEIDD